MCPACSEMNSSGDFLVPSGPGCAKELKDPADIKAVERMIFDNMFIMINLKTAI